MRLYALRIPTSVMLLAGSLVLAIATAGIVGALERRGQHRRSERTVARGTQADKAASTSVEGETVMLAAGDLVQSIPPAWSFIEERGTTEAVSLRGGMVKARCVVRSREPGAMVERIEYRIEVHAALVEALKAYPMVWKFGQREAWVVPFDDKRGLLLKGSYSAVFVLDVDVEGRAKGWAQDAAENFPSDVQVLLQAIRLP